MPNVLVLFAHPRFEQSRTNAALLKYFPQDERVTFRDLYELYPDFHVDVQAEQAMLLAHDVIIWHHPFYWYSSPPLLKQWIDLVLQFGWAYGPGGESLRGKYVFNAFSAGGSLDRYQTSGSNRYTIHEFLRPFEQTARLCHMTYLPPFVVGGTHRLSAEDLDRKGRHYGKLLHLLAEGSFDFAKINPEGLMNDHIYQGT